MPEQYHPLAGLLEGTTAALSQITSDLGDITNDLQELAAELRALNARSPDDLTPLIRRAQGIASSAATAATTARDTASWMEQVVQPAERARSTLP